MRVYFLLAKEEEGEWVLQRRDGSAWQAWVCPEPQLLVPGPVHSHGTHWGSARGPRGAVSQT